jgi:hypothetical protein
MGTNRIDTFARVVGSRRRALGGVLAGAALLTMPTATAGRKKKPKKKACRVKSGQCLCRSGQRCLDNGSCTKICTVQGPQAECPSGCSCGSSFTLGNAFFCQRNIDQSECADLPQCGSNAECPRGFICRATGCQGVGPVLCQPLCPT